MKQNMQDLTEGPLGKKILIFSVPLMLSNLLQVLFNMADIAVIGQFAGSLSLGAVGSTATWSPWLPDSSLVCPAVSMY